MQKQNTAYTPYIQLGNVIILQGVKASRAANKSLVYSPNIESTKNIKRKVARFFHSRLFRAITQLDPDMLIAQLKQEVKSL